MAASPPDVVGTGPARLEQAHRDVISGRERRFLLLEARRSRDFAKDGADWPRIGKGCPHAVFNIPQITRVTVLENVIDERS
jgi:hypothetical protein